MNPFSDYSGASPVFVEIQQTNVGSGSANPLQHRLVIIDTVFVEVLLQADEWS